MRKILYRSSLNLIKINGEEGIKKKDIKRKGSFNFNYVYLHR